MTNKETIFLDSRRMAYRLTIEVVRRVCSKRKKKVFNIKRTLRAYKNDFLVYGLSKRTKLLNLKRRNDAIQKELDFYYELIVRVSPYYNTGSIKRSCNDKPLNLFPELELDPPVTPNQLVVDDNQLQLCRGDGTEECITCKRYRCDEKHHSNLNLYNHDCIKGVTSDRCNACHSGCRFYISKLVLKY